MNSVVWKCIPAGSALFFDFGEKWAETQERSPETVHRVDYEKGDSVVWSFTNFVKEHFEAFKNEKIQQDLCDIIVSHVISSQVTRGLLPSKVTELQLAPVVGLDLYHY